MMSLRDLLDYYKADKLNFNQIMLLYVNGSLSLQNGEVSSSDLREICKNFNLPNFDIRATHLPANDSSQQSQQLQQQSGSANPFEGKQLEELLLEISSGEREVYRLEKDFHQKSKHIASSSSTSGSPAFKEAQKSRQELFDKIAYLSDAYYAIYRLDAVQDGYLSKSLSLKKKALGFYDSSSSSSQTVSDKRRVADMLMDIGISITVNYIENNSAGKYLTAEEGAARKSEAMSYLQKSLDTNESILSSFKTAEARARADENAKLAVANFWMYRASGIRSYLNHANSIRESYCQYDTASRHSQMFGEIAEAHAKPESQSKQKVQKVKK